METMPMRKLRLRYSYIRAAHQLTSAPERLAHAFLKGVFLGVSCWRCSQTQTHY